MALKELAQAVLTPGVASMQQAAMGTYPVIMQRSEWDAFKRKTLGPPPDPFQRERWPGNNTRTNDPLYLSPCSLTSGDQAWRLVETRVKERNESGTTRQKASDL